MSLFAVINYARNLRRINNRRKNEEDNENTNESIYKKKKLIMMLSQMIMIQTLIQQNGYVDLQKMYFGVPVLSPVYVERPQQDQRDCGTSESFHMKLNQTSVDNIKLYLNLPWDIGKTIHVYLSLRNSQNILIILFLQKNLVGMYIYILLS